MPSPASDILFNVYASPTGDASGIATSIDIYCDCLFGRLQECCSAIGRMSIRDDLPECVLQIPSYLGMLDRNDQRKLIYDPRFGILLLRLEQQLASDIANVNFPVSLQLCVGGLLFFLLPSISNEFLGQDISFAVYFAAEECISPFGVTWYISPKKNGPMRVLVRVSEQQVLLQTDKGHELARIPFTDLEPHSVGKNLFITASWGNLQLKQFSEFSGFEISSLTSLPEVLGGCKPSNWLNVPYTPELGNRLNETVNFLRHVWIEGYEDVRQFCRIIVPLETPSQTPGSVASATIPGIVGATFSTPDPLLCAELLVHEVSHIKLDLLLRRTTLFFNDGPALYRHPWRSDRRPIMGVMFAAHAFVAVLQLYARALHCGLGTRSKKVYSLLYTQVAESLNELERHAEYTSDGRRFMDILLTSFRATKLSSAVSLDVV